MNFDMKKLISLLMAISIIFNFVFAAAADETIIYENDFNKDTAGGFAKYFGANGGNANERQGATFRVANLNGNGVLKMSFIGNAYDASFNAMPADLRADNNEVTIISYKLLPNFTAEGAGDFLNCNFRYMPTNRSTWLLRFKGDGTIWNINGSQKISGAYHNGQWNYIDLVFNTKENTYLVYINGESVFTKQTLALNPTPDTNYENSGLMFGGAPSVPVDFYMDDFRVYKTSKFVPTKPVSDPPKVSAEDSQPQFANDFEKSMDFYGDHVKLLANMGVIPEYGNPDAVITRAELVGIVLSALGIDIDELGLASGKFADVPASHPQSGAINMAANLGLISGIDEQFFYPDENITLIQCVKVLLSALGYSIVADTLGEYPTGYLLAAYRYGVFKGIDVNDITQDVTVPILSKMFYNVLELDMVESTYLGEESYKIVKDSCILTKLNIIKYTGLITANDFTTVPSVNGQPSHAARKGYVLIGNKMFEDKNGTFKNYLGVPTTVYYKDNQDLEYYTALFASPANPGFTKLFLTADMIRNVDITGQSINLIYSNISETNRNEEKVASIALSAVELYNYRYSGTLAFDLNSILTSLNGSIMMYDNEGDGVFDVVHIREYNPYIVSRSYATDNKIYVTDKSINVLDVDPNGKDAIIITKLGAPASIEDIRENAVIEHYVSKDGKVIFINIVSGISSQSVLTPLVISGVISEIISEDGYLACIIDDMRYDMTKKFFQDYGKMLHVGDNVQLNLDSQGRIVGYLPKNNAAENIGYLIAIGGAKDVLNPKVQAKILSGQDHILYYDFADKVQVIYNLNNGIMHTETVRRADIPTHSALTKTTGGKMQTNSQIIKFYTNDEGKINKIQTPKVEMDMECVPVTDLQDDGTPKSLDGTGYTQNVYYLHQENISLQKAGIDLINPNDPNGLLPVNILASSERNDNDSDLRLHYKNYDIGQYTTDPDFSFMKISGMVTDSYNSATYQRGVIRNVFRTSLSSGDTSDALQNLPGRISRPVVNEEQEEHSIAVLDDKYFISSDTKIFVVPGEYDAVGNVYNAYNKADDAYYTITVNNLVGGSYIFAAVYNITERNKVSYMTIIDSDDLRMSLQNTGAGGLRTSAPSAVVAKDPIRIFKEDGEYHKIPVYYGKRLMDLYAPVENNISDEGHILRFFDDNGKLIGPQGYYYDTTKKRSGTSLLYTDSPTGLFQGTSVNDLKPGDVFQYSLDSKGNVNAIRVLFKLDKCKDFYYEANFATLTDKFGNSTMDINKANNIQNQSLASSGYSNNVTARQMMWGEVLAADSASSAYNYVIVKTAMPTWAYFDRVLLGNFRQILLSNESFDPVPKPVERFINLHSSCNVYILEENTIRTASFQDIQKGDQLFTFQTNNTVAYGVSLIIR
ncbi:MAG: S-layer homology domain-containing protein [Firmicutes bacterium]|nr:S-layer homology domain-containing protein [Bacillota bacterium]